MGIIAKQTIQGSFFSYLGVILGGINVAVLYPRILSEDQIGLINILIALSAIFAQFSSLGINGVTKYFFHYFRDLHSKHHGYFSVIVAVTLIGFAGFVIVFGLFNEQILSTRVEDSALLSDYGIYVIPITFFTLTFLVFDIYAAVLFKSVIGTFLKDFVFRIANMILILGLYFGLLDFADFLFLYTLALAIPPVVILAELGRKGHLSWKRPDPELVKQHGKQMKSVGRYFILAGFGSMMVTYIDRYMINLFLGLGATGIYSVTNYVGKLVQIPRQSMGKIAATMLARLWSENKHNELQKLYNQSSFSQLMLGIYIFIGIWINVDAVFTIIPQDYDSGKWVIFFIGLANVFQCFLGLGGLFIATSPHYKVRTYLIFILGIMVIITNLLFIPVWGITGAAIASALSKMLFVAFNMLFLKFRLGIVPLQRKHWIIPLAGVASYFTVFYLPLPDMHWILTLIVKSVLITVVYGFFLKTFRVVPNVKHFFHSF
ncbi:MAG: polysaccharide biosynthesis C-terminal domain-containing protein [Marinilabilia sp.]